MTSYQAPSANIMPYVLQFILGWAALTAVAVAVVFMLEVDAPGATGLIITLAVAAGVGSNFARKEGRAMTRRESLSLANLGTAISTLLGLAGFALFFMVFAGFSFGDLALLISSAEIPVWMVVMFVAIGLALSWSAIYFASGSFSKQTAKQMQKNTP